MIARTTTVFLIISLTITIVAAQLQFPADYVLRPQARSTETRIPVPNTNFQSQQVATTTTTHQDNSYKEYITSVVAQGLTQLALDVNRISQAVSPQAATADYVVLGPLTITGALSLVLLASIGQTFDELSNCLGISSVPTIREDPIHIQQQIGKAFDSFDATTGLDVGQRVIFANGIFLQQDFPIRPAYQEAVQAYYKSNVLNLDFLGNPEHSKHVINTWVSGRTNNKIPSLLDEAPPPDTTAIIVSVLYFQAKWQYPFYNGHTKVHPFYANGRKSPSTRMVEMMSNGGDFPYYRDMKLGVEIMGFPYEGNRSTMYVIMPRESNIEKLKQLENSLTPGDIHHLIDNAQYTEAVILFPKMKLETTIDLKSTLQQMGVRALFDPAKSNLALLSPGVSQRFNEANEALFVSAPIPTNNKNGFQAPPAQRVPPPQRAPPAQRAPPSQKQAPVLPQPNLEEQLIFTRFNAPPNSSCTPIFDPETNTRKCQVQLTTTFHQSPRAKRASPRSARAGNDYYNSLDELERIRQQVIQNPLYANPGLYADQVIHKVYMDITESGTEAAAATGISLNRSGGRVTFRVDVPFLFFIYHEDSKVILFWGTVKSPPSA